MKTSLEVMAKAVANIDGGCCSCITGFLEGIELEDAKEIADWVNKNDPIYGKEKLIYFTDVEEWRSQ